MVAIVVNILHLIGLLESETGPTYRHFRKATFNKRFQELPEEVQAKAKAVFKTLQADPTRTDLAPLHQVKGVYRISVTTGRPGYRAAARRIGNDMFWFFIGTHAQYDKEVLGMR